MVNSGHNRQSCIPFTLLFLLACALFFQGTAEAKDDLRLAATLDRSTIPISSQATLRLNLDGARSAQIDIPETPGLHIERRGQSSQIAMTNGSISSQVIYTYIIEPQQVGSFTIPSITAKVDGREISTEPLQLQVTSQKGVTPRKNKSLVKEESSSINEQDQATFITLTGLEDHAYIGEVMPLTIKAYFLRGIKGDINKRPELQSDAFILTDLESSPRQSVETYNNRIYSVMTWNALISPIAAGEKKLYISLDTTLFLPQKRQNRRGFSPFADDDVFNQFFGVTEKKEKTLKSAGTSIQVKPLPEEGQPKSFSGAVGSFLLTVKAEPESVKVGEPITLNMTISGSGNFDRVQSPPFPANSDWKTYPSNARREKSGLGKGKKIFEQAVIPLHQDIEALPSLAFSFFDPEKKKYITLKSYPIPLTIEPLPEPATPSAQKATTLIMPKTAPAAEQEQAPPPQLPLQIRLHTGDFVQAIEPVFMKIWFQLVTLFSVLLLLFSLLFTVKKNYEKKHLRQLEEKREKQRLREEVKVLQREAQAREAAHTLHLAKEAIQRYLAHKWGSTAPAITRGDLENHFPQDSPYIKIFRACDQADYGGQPPTHAEVVDILFLLEKQLEMAR